ncbi:hypothetical protein QWY85_16425 [Neolewinella lacunae]|uniref:Lipoprotein n=1 Tax=Neolewinella lacunae TaxID=1517758 RepID=A0A923PLG1_9BACT|nr:hypothetical protein [Neolewinella lacunae]MBC6993469.1 hypothetical protein [Neolewinella lacunae]MDN3636255.1 hypothetical protein [Neolewinella lacunae]
MRRPLLFLLAIVTAAMLSACLTIENKVTLRADGSGEQVATVDLGEMISNPFFKMAMEEEMAKNGKPEGEQSVDSTWVMLDQLGPLNPDWSAGERDLVGRANGRMYINFEEGVGYVKTFFAFDDVAQIAQFNALMAKANKPEEENPMAGFGGQDGMLSSYTLQGKKFTCTSSVSPDFVNPMANSDLGEEGAEMMKQMFSDASIIYTLELPGKVKKVKGFPGHTVEGKTLTQVIPFLDLMDKPQALVNALSGEVKFK